LIFSANTGDDPSLDIDRRHIASVSVARPDMRMITSGSGAATTPTFVEGGKKVAFLSSTYNRRALPAVLPVGAKKFEILGMDKIGKELASMNYVVPEQVIYTAEDGVRVHAQLFEKKDGRSNKPAIVFVHGGPERQMMLSWDHRRYYAHTYAMNQYF